MDDRKVVDHVDKARVDAAAAGTMAGGTAGAVIGAVVGGPVGAGIGGVVGSAAGGAAGAALDYSSVEPEFHEEWERGPYKASSAWNDASSAYQYGWENYDRPEFRGRLWPDVRDALKKGWSHTTRWEDYEPMVHSAWDRRLRQG